jgi:hypothetical protein
MFYAIHRAIKFLLFCCVLWVGWKIYQHRHVAEPAVIWYEVWDNGGFREKPMPVMTGFVERVLSSQTFTMITTNPAALRVNVRLLGLEEPAKERSPEILIKEQKRTEALDRLIKGKEVRLHVGYENFNNVGGVLFLGPTNINAYLIQQRLAFTDKELVKGFNKEFQYQMLWSKRHVVTNN